ncbi:DUF3331 domain-containing protein [Paraburkholderia caffeinilytica]|uniref:DUF3331 domain-containing protein n=1 Tax=Paraburkholderia caffeinilytica TaxID=1761016 RepID=UPI0038BCC738
MTALSEDNIVVRTLLNVLDPSAEQLDACSKKSFVKLNKRRARRCVFAVEEHRGVSSRPANIVVVERLSSCTISVSWSDPCSGRYTEQIWCGGFSHVSTVCALTGRTINRGDPVFRPRTREVRVPPNRHQMILAATIWHRADLAIAGT